MRAASRTGKGYGAPAQRVGAIPDTTVPARDGRERPAPAAPSWEQIRQRAFQIYEMRVKQGVPGDAVSDWLQAERECACTETDARAASLRASLRGETLLKDPT